jgi:hypothetical protein
MARLPEPTKGTVLDQDYAKYGFPLRTGPRYVALVLASDPWEYLDYHLRDELGERGAERPRAFLEQARDFFQAAESHRVSSRPLLYYYSFLNLAKVLLLARGVSLDDRPIHGLKMIGSGQAGGKRFAVQKVTVERRGPGKAVFPQLVAELGGSVTNGQELKVIQLLQQIVGIHGTWADVKGERGCFAHARLDPMISADLTGVYGRVLLEKPWGSPDLHKAIAKRMGLSQVRIPSDCRPTEPSSSSLACLETRRVKPKGRGYLIALSAVAQTLRRDVVHALLTRQGYRLYLSDFGAGESARLPQVASIYAAMFYLGSITRYQPQDFDTIVRLRWAWLVSDFLNSQPRQFLYLMASEISGNEVVIPFGQLD